MNKFLYLNKKLIFSLVAIFFLILSIGAISQPVYGYVDDADVGPMNSDPIKFTPQVTIPGSEFQMNVVMPLENSTAPIARYISAIYNYGVGIVGIVAALMLMLGGIIWLTAAGSSSKIEEAKSIITSSLTGMALVFTAYILLNTINPNLVNLKTTAIIQLAELQCCEITTGGTTTAAMTQPDQCRASNGQVKSLDYLVSGNTCQKGGCCISSEIPSSLVSGVATIFASDMLAETKLTYKASFEEGCDAGTSFPTSAFVTGGLFGDVKKTIFVSAACSEVKQQACTGKAEYDNCLGESRWGFCYDNRCLAGKGEVGDPCGNEKGSRCIKESAENSCTQDWGGMGCVGDLWCCKTAEQGVQQPMAVCSAGNLGNSCLTSNNQFGFCKNSTCVTCSKYNESCSGGSKNYECPDQAFNAQTNPGQQCGYDANNNNGDCWCNVLGNNCTCDFN